MTPCLLYTWFSATAHVACSQYIMAQQRSNDEGVLNYICAKSTTIRKVWPRKWMSETLKILLKLDISAFWKRRRVCQNFSFSVRPFWSCSKRSDIQKVWPCELRSRTLTIWPKFEFKFNSLTFLSLRMIAIKVSGICCLFINVTSKLGSWLIRAMKIKYKSRCK